MMIDNRAFAGQTYEFSLKNDGSERFEGCTFDERNG